MLTASSPPSKPRYRLSPVYRSAPVSSQRSASTESRAPAPGRPHTRSQAASSTSPRPVPTSPKSPSPSSAPRSDAHKHRFVDAGTQYSPPDWPPTSSRSSLRRLKSVASPEAPTAPSSEPPLETSTVPLAAPVVASAASPRGDPSHSSTTPAKSESNLAPLARSDLVPSAPSDPPPAPRVRETPETSLQGASGNAKRLKPSGSSVSVSDTIRSSPKGGSRPRDGQGRMVPRDYAQCNNKDLGSLISALLIDLIKHNDEIPLQDGHLTRFHSRSPPGISVTDYMQRLAFHGTLPAAVMLAMVYYIDKLCNAFPTFTINSLTVHRFLITAATVAAKGLCDVFWTNATYAKVGGVSVKELAILELELLTRVDWEIVPATEQLAEYYRNLVERHEEYDFEAEGQEAESPDAMDVESSPEQAVG